MKITQVTVSRFHDPESASKSAYGAEILVATISTDEGLDGIGFITGSAISGPLLSQMISMALAPALRGENAGDTERLWDKMYNEVLPRRGGDGLMRYAIAAVDMALWDIKAKAAGVPLWKLLGGRRALVPTYANCAHHLPVDELAMRAKKYVDAGHRALKIRGTRSFVTPAEATARVQSVREAVGEDVRLMVDVNGSWDVDTAIQQLKRWQPYNVYWLEEPVPPHDIPGYKRVRHRSGGTYIAGGEQHVGLMEFQHLIDNGCIDVAQPNAAMTGGITDWLRINAYAASRSVPVSPWNLQQVHIHLAAAFDNVQWIEYFMSDNALLEFQGSLLAGSELSEVVEDDGVYLRAPAQPGIGISIDPEVAEKSRID